MNASRLGTTAVPSTVQNVANFGVGPSAQPSFSNDAGELNLTPDSRIKRIKSSLTKSSVESRREYRFNSLPVAAMEGLSIMSFREVFKTGHVCLAHRLIVKNRLYNSSKIVKRVQWRSELKSIL
jgi:hypothetical protein